MAFIVETADKFTCYAGMPDSVTPTKRLATFKKTLDADYEYHNGSKYDTLVISSKVGLFSINIEATPQGYTQESKVLDALQGDQISYDEQWQLWSSESYCNNKLVSVREESTAGVFVQKRDIDGKVELEYSIDNLPNGAHKTTKKTYHHGRFMGGRYMIQDKNNQLLEFGYLDESDNKHRLVKTRTKNGKMRLEKYEHGVNLTRRAQLQFIGFACAVSAVLGGMCGLLHYVSTHSAQDKPVPVQYTR